MAGRIAKDKAERIERKDRERAEYPSSQDSTLFRHNVVTIYTMLEKEIGLPPKQADASKARVLSYGPSSAQAEEARQLPVSPYLTKWPRELSEALAGMDAEGDESSEQALKLGRLLQGQKYKMGWYKVPRISYDYAPATMDPVLMD